MAIPQNTGAGGKRITNSRSPLFILYKPFPKSITVFDDNILMHVWLSELPLSQLTRIIDGLLHFHIDFSLTIYFILCDKGAKNNNYYFCYGNKINISINFNFRFLLLLLLEAIQLQRSFSLLNELFPFGSISAAVLPVSYSHVCYITFYIILPHVFRSSFWSCWHGCPLIYFLYHAIIWHSIYMSKPS